MHILFERNGNSDEEYEFCIIWENSLKNVRVLVSLHEDIWYMILRSQNILSLGMLAT